MEYYNKGIKFAQQGIDLSENNEDKDKFLRLVKLIRSQSKLFKQSFITNLTKFDSKALSSSQVLKTINLYQQDENQAVLAKPVPEDS